MGIVLGFLPDLTIEEIEMKSSLLRFAVPCCLALFLTTAGCEQGSEDPDKEAKHEHGHEHGHDHEHAERPESFRVAMAKLKEMSDKIASAMENDDSKAAHGPLHDVGKLLKVLPELAADTDLAEGDWKEIKEASDSLFEVFGDVDSTFHKKDGDKSAAYEKAKTAIEEGITILEAKLALLKDDHKHSDHAHKHDHEHEHDEVESDDHDNDEHDHDHEEDHDHDHEEHEDSEEHRE